MNLRSFDLNLLVVLDALLREGSTIRAGEKVGLSQPAVSAALARLRHALDDPLFIRQGQGLAPTDFARALAMPLRAMALAFARLGTGHGMGAERAKAAQRIRASVAENPFIHRRRR